MLKIYHTGDNHLGASFLQLGKKAQEHRTQLERTFQRIIERTIQDHCDMLLVAGDLFDSNTPPQSAIDIVHRGLHLLNQHHIIAVLLPGTHDHLMPHGVYAREQFEQQYTTTFVFHDPQETSYEIPELNCTVHANPLTSNKSTQHPLRNLKRNTQTTYNIALAHGSIAIPGKHAIDDWPITQQEIAASNMDYIALAHWHTHGNYTAGNTQAWYCGSPETLSAAQSGVGNILAVNWDPSINVKPVSIGKRNVIQTTVDIDPSITTNALFEILQTITKHHPETLAFITLRGFRSPELQIRTENLERELGRECAYVSLCDETQLHYQESDLQEMPEESIIRIFAHDIQQQIRKAKTNKERHLLEDTLQVGISELQGKRIID